MKRILNNLNKAFENKTRLGIMAVLVANEYIDFNGLKDLLGVTDGNLASHIKHLEKKKYVRFSKEFVDRKPKTRYFATEEGRTAFEQHIKAIEQLLK